MNIYITRSSVNVSEKLKVERENRGEWCLNYIEQTIYRCRQVGHEVPEGPSTSQVMRSRGARALRTPRIAVLSTFRATTVPYRVRKCSIRVTAAQTSRNTSETWHVHTAIATSCGGRRRPSLPASFRTLTQSSASLTHPPTCSCGSARTAMGSCSCATQPGVRSPGVHGPLHSPVFFIVQKPSDVRLRRDLRVSLWLSLRAGDRHRVIIH